MRYSLGLISTGFTRRRRERRFDLLPAISYDPLFGIGYGFFARLEVLAKWLIGMARVNDDSLVPERSVLSCRCFWHGALLLGRDALDTT